MPLIKAIFALYLWNLGLKSIGEDKYSSPSKTTNNNDLINLLISLSTFDEVSKIQKIYFGRDYFTRFTCSHQIYTLFTTIDFFPDYY